MNFSDAFRQSKNLCKLSPDGKYLVSATDFRIIVRDAESLQIQNLYACLDAVQYIEWSADSKFLLCGMFKRGVVQIWSLDVPEWKCKIDEGSTGLSSVRWAPDARHIITTADFNLRLTVWSLVRKTVSYIKYPKHGQKGLDFSQDGRQMVLGEHRHCRDYISIFDTSTWQLSQHFQVATDDMAGVKISPDQTTIAVWDSCLQYLVLLYTTEGRCVGKYRAYENALGVKTVSWSPSTQFLAVGSYDQKVIHGLPDLLVEEELRRDLSRTAILLQLRLLNNVTWKPSAMVEHPDLVNGDSTVIYKEVMVRKPDIPQDLDTTAGSLFTGNSKYEVITGLRNIPVQRPDLNKANPRLGVSYANFSPDNEYMCTKNDNMNTVLWIWDMKDMHLSTILIQDAPIRCIEWDPTKSRLALCTGTDRLFMWSLSGSLAVEVPVEGMFPIMKLSWHPEGKSVLLQSKTQFCVCYL